MDRTPFAEASLLLSRVPMRLGVMVVGVMLLACSERQGTEAAPCVSVLVEQELPVPRLPAVDLLLVVGGGGADATQHAARARELARVVRALVSGDWDGDGAMDGLYAPGLDLHVGVISTSMGSGGYAVEGCAPYDVGEDGTWRDLECADESPAFLAFGAGDDPGELARFVGCRAERPSCSIAQPLEAALKALSPAAATARTSPEYVAPHFFDGTTGHGDGANAGFLRAHSLLAVIVLSGVDDCSARDVSLYDPASHPEATQALACARTPGALHPISRFVDGLLALRRWPSRLSLSVIGGLPVDLTPELGASPDYARLLSSDPAVRDPRMQPRPDEVDATQLAAACESAGRGRGTPALRLIETARALERRGAAVGLASVCAGDYRAATAPIVRQTARTLEGRCLNRPLGDECEADLILPEGMGCDAVPGSTQRAVEDGSALCTLARVEPTAAERAARVLPSEPGWLVDDYTEEAEWYCGLPPGEMVGMVTVVPKPSWGTRVLLRCRLPLAASGSTGAFCTVDEDYCGELDTALPLACDVVSRTCGVRCDRDEDCASLSGHVCDLRPLEAVAPMRFEGDASPRGFCVNPTCR